MAKFILTKDQMVNAVREYLVHHPETVPQSGVVASITPHFVLHDDRCAHSLEERFEGYLVEIE